MPKPLENADFIAKILRTSKQEVWRRTRKGEIPCVRLGRRMLFDPERIERWIAAGGTAASDERGAA